jgi:hypothetical protein
MARLTSSSMVAWKRLGNTAINLARRGADNLLTYRARPMIAVLLLVENRWVNEQRIAVRAGRRCNAHPVRFRTLGLDCERIWPCVAIANPLEMMALWEARDGG